MTNFFRDFISCYEHLGQFIISTVFDISHVPYMALPCFTVFTPPQVLSLHLPLESSSKCRVSLKNPKDIMSWSSQHSSTRDIERCRGTTDDFRWSKFRGADVDVMVGPSIANDTLPGGLKNPVVSNNSPFTPRIFRAEEKPSDTPIYIYIFWATFIGFFPITRLHL